MYKGKGQMYKKHFRLVHEVRHLNFPSLYIFFPPPLSGRASLHPTNSNPFITFSLFPAF